MRGDLAAGLVALAALVAGVTSQLPGRITHEKTKETRDAYLLPPPEHLVVMSLGHRSALADVLWAKLLVSQGLRLSERRRYDIAVEHIDAINELDPKWRDPYKLSDSLITMQAKAPPRDQIYATRRILERGVHERPMDAELWLILGQFVAFIAPGTFLDDDPEEAERWRHEGVDYLARAAELAPSDANIVWGSLGGAGIYARMGRLDRAVEMYTVILATTDDAELRGSIEKQLGDLLAAKRIESVQLMGAERRKRFEEIVRDRYPGLSPGKAALLGFPRDLGRCAGGSLSNAPASDCAETWRDWAELAPVAAPKP